MFLPIQKYGTLRIQLSRLRTYNVNIWEGGQGDVDLEIDNLFVHWAHLD